jgi:hypothetical protein
VTTQGDGFWLERMRDAAFDAAFAERGAGMHQPVECCWCGGVYDLGTVTVTGRYADCSVWEAPCCGRTVDDRGETGWKPTQDYRRLRP